MDGSPTSIVTRIEPDLPDGPRFIAVKTSTTTHAKEPHDIIKEVRLLASLSHPNVIPLIKHEISRSQNLSLWMPYIPYTLEEVLQSSRFSPHPIISFGSTTSSSPTPREVQFVVLAKSIIFQVLCGMSYLHSEHVQIAHRDVKPSNVLLTPMGCAQIIDFGIAFHVGEDRASKAKDLWPEYTARMYFEVSTGPYRAPELLFGPRTYNAFAIDAWSLGATFAEFFTPLHLQDDDEDEQGFSFQSSDRMPDFKSEPGSDAGAPASPPAPFVIPPGTHMRPGMPSGRWSRASLFDGTRGEIGLAWSIFKIRGTPNADTWPSFLTLPDANKVFFADVPATDLTIRLPNLPPTTTSASLRTDTATHAPCSDPVSTPLDLLHRFLVYEPSRRLHLSESLDHPWFRAEPGLVLPADSEEDIQMGRPAWVSEAGAVTRSFIVEGQSRTLGDLLRMHVVSKEH
ncbi:kinase-like domain-containing protein [Boletus edulis BED1]|uniref:cyclin-dependent kinase n=1 Tax=Boletus edulis BED1 TaxID=1328754 RepID=A0AAD4BNK9_BOLED|nr:kinase-like domain-containing protein [Boletus edulis BED1]